jgi:protein TonB
VNIAPAPASIPALDLPDIAEAPAIPETDRGTWGIAAGLAFALHAGAIVAITAAVVPSEPTVPEPVVLVELPPAAGPATPDLPAATPQEPQAQPELPQPQAVIEPVDIPPVKAPLPRNVVTLPPPQPEPIRHIEAPAPLAPIVSAPAPARSGVETSRAEVPGNDPRSRKIEANYKSLVGSYIRRNKFSPPQSRRAGISGDVKVRFIVHRDGAITDVTVAASSGEALLDGEAIAFLQSLSPVPSFPRDLRRSEIPLAITLKFKVESK